jgi:dihydropyrimidinase
VNPDVTQGVLAPISADLVVRNGTVVGPGSAVRADVVIADGKVRALAEPGQATAGQPGLEIDATGRLVLPGGVDPHCHVGFTSGAFTTLDEYPQATEAAVHGGTTTIVDFAIPRPGEVPLEVAVAQQAKASQGLCDTALHGCVVKWDASVPGQLRDLMAMGVVTVKMFTTYRGETMASDETIFKVMKELRDLGGMAFIHCEANHIIEEQQELSSASGRIAARYHHRTRPAIAETASVSAVIAMAEALGTAVYLVHQSTPGCLDLAAAARLRGIPVFSEAVTHHLVLDDSKYGEASPERYVCCPPLRPKPMVDALAAGLWSGSISTIGSDHCCYDTRQKTSAMQDVRMMPNGLPGVELRMPVIFSEFVHKAGLPVERFVELCSTTPAKASGIWPQKGELLPGSDADLVIWDPDATRLVRAAELHMATDYSPFNGMEVIGWPETVLVRGHVVIDRGRLVDARPRGMAVRGRPVVVGRSRVRAGPDLA